VLIFKALHILSMFAAVTALVGTEIFIVLAIWRRDVQALAMIYRLTRRPSPTVVGLFFLLVGIAFGLLTAATSGFDFLAGWLIAAYVLVVALILVNLSPPKRKVRKVAIEAIEAEAGRRPVEEVERNMANVPTANYFATNLVLLAAIIADMVLKPF
jgi:Zn-dependent protease with chaperone function